jgi:hypothetical protein
MLKITTGSITSTPPAAILPHSQPSYCMKLTIATGAVMAFVRVRMRAKKKSFHDRMKHSTAVAARPGAASGSVMRKNAPQTLQPSIQAASSSARGTLSKKVCIIQMTSARLKVR